jgi:hypothetical protein
MGFWYDQTGLTQETGAATRTYLRDPSGLLLSKMTTDLYNYGLDRLGSVTAMADTTGAPANTYNYGPCGAPRVFPGKRARPTLPAGLLPSNLERRRAGCNCRSGMRTFRPS